MVIILFGVTGTGKTEVGRALANDLGWSFYDADQFHAPESVEKMRRGVALTDNDRWPWLDSLRAKVEQCIRTGENAVLACSALKAVYRHHLAVDGQVKLVYLKGDYSLIAERLRHRREHFMNPELLRSQFDTLEEPEGEGALVVDVRGTPAELVKTIRDELNV